MKYEQTKHKKRKLWDKSAENKEDLKKKENKDQSEKSDAGNATRSEKYSSDDDYSSEMFWSWGGDRIERERGYDAYGDYIYLDSLTYSKYSYQELPYL